MNGHVDNAGRALVTVSVRPSDAAAGHQLQVWVDTGFNGDLVIPLQQIDDLALPHSGTAKAVLADGSQVTLKTYTCVIDWFGEERHLEVVANEGDCAAIPGEVPLVEGCVGCQLLGLEVG